MTYRDTIEKLLACCDFSQPVEPEPRVKTWMTPDGRLCSVMEVPTIVAARMIRDGYGDLLQTGETFDEAVARAKAEMGCVEPNLKVDPLGCHNRVHATPGHK